MRIKLLKIIDRIAGNVVTSCMPLAQPQSLACIRRILFIRPGGIGDAVLLIPAILALKAEYPDSEITVLAEKRNGAIFHLCPVVDRLLRYDNPGELLAAIRTRYDVVIDTEQWHRLSAVVSRIIKSPVKIGYATNERQKLFTHPIPYSHGNYELDSFFHLLAPLNIPLPWKVALPFLEIPAESELRAAELLGLLAGKPFVAISPGATIPERRWGADKFNGVAERLSVLGLPVVVGGEEDVADGKRIIAGKHGLNLAGMTSLAETAAVIAKAAVLVSGDSGILHIGAGLDKPTVSLFGPGIAAKWAPRGEKHIVLNKELSCSPCTTFGHTPSCPISARCLAEITVEEVVEAVEKYFAMSAVGRL